MTQNNLRAAVCELLLRCEAAQQYSNIALDTALSRGSFTGADRGLFTALFYGVTEHRITLDHVIDTHSKLPASKIEPRVRAALRLGLCQLLYFDRIPDHAAINESVSLVPTRSRGFVNAILRAFLRANKQIAFPDRERDPITYLSVRYSFAPAICERFVAVFGFSRTEQLLASFCTPPPVTLRINTLRTSRDALLTELTENGFDAMPSTESAQGILLYGNAPVPALPGFSDGRFFVQDEASQLCVEALDARPDMTAIDVCACPGSKSFGIAACMENRGRLLSCDLHQNKLSLVKSGAERLGISIIETVARDAREPNPDWIGAFDRVLCDVPCSGFGVFAKKPELRYKNPAESAGLPEIQFAILCNASAFLRAGGVLVYSTCTLLPEENEKNVARFLQAHPDFTLLRERTLTPDVDDTDGFYFAVLQKR